MSAFTSSCNTRDNSPTVCTPTSSAGSINTEKNNQHGVNAVAVVGMACRVPGENNSPEQLWQSLLDKKDASGEIPPLRWEPYHRRDPRNPDILRQIPSRGYYIPDLDKFDSQFFGISPKEAEQMDPQQFLALEVTWEALESAGIRAKSLSGSDTAVFWGTNSDDYSKLLLEDLPNIEAWMGIGTAYCGIPNRISYHLNLKGPSTAVDAACASSLVAVHHGEQSILNGESKVAIVGGGNAICSPNLTRVLQKAGAISSDGRCRSFDDEACGYGRGEGAVAIVLKSLRHALNDGDHIQAVVKGTAVAQDGKTNGIMAPNAASQELVAQKALNMSGIDSRMVHFVEAHATSTAVGDPTEISALSNVYGKYRTPDNPCFIGSIKPNIGHLEAGAGGMGFLKAVLALRKGILPPQANLTTPNTQVDWAKSGLKIVHETSPWPESRDSRRAAICSYGYGGTVSHAVIEEFCSPSPVGFSVVDKIELRSDDQLLLLISAPHRSRLAVQARTLKHWLRSEGGKQEDLRSIAKTLAVRRDHHAYRAALVVDSHESAVDALESLEMESNHPWLAQNMVLGPETRKDVVWVFSGHGAQWTDMGKELVHNVIFLDAVNPLNDIVEAEIGVSPIHMLETGAFDGSDEIQILTYLIQIGISAVLDHRGVFPHAIIGHSVGEVAASAIAGAITREEGTRIVTRRARLYRKAMGQGAMLLVNKPYVQIEEELAGGTDIVAAIDSSPSTCVISGAKDAIKQATDNLEARGVKVFPVKTDIAFHSPSLGFLGEPLIGELADLAPAAPVIPLYSTSRLDPRSQLLRGPQYWVDNTLSPVRLTSAIDAAIADGYRIFLEISSHPLLSHSFSDTLANAKIEESAVIPTLVRNKPSEKQIMLAIAQLHCCGANVKWTAQLPGPWASGVPTTTWIHQPVLRQVETGILGTGLTHDPEKHTLVGRPIQVAGTDTTVFTTHLDNKSKPFPGSHPLHGTEIIPAACLLNTFFQATGANSIRSVVLRSPVAINAPRSVQVILEPREIRIMSRLIPGDGSSADEDCSSWVTHTTAQWVGDSVQPSAQPPTAVDIVAVRARIRSRLSNSFTVDYLNKVGVSSMGFPWAVKEHHGNNREMVARVDSAEHMNADDELPWDPSSWASILDAATSVGSTLFFEEPCLRMPAEIESVEIFSRDRAPRKAWLYVEKASDSELTSHVAICDDTGAVLARFTSMRFSEIEGTPGANGSVESLVHQITWPPVAPAEEPLPISRVVLLSNNRSLREAYASTLPKDTGRVIVDSVAALATYASQSSSQTLKESTAIVYIPDSVENITEIAAAVKQMTWELLEAVKLLVNRNIRSKLFVLTLQTGEAETPAALAHSSLLGLSRVLSNEHPDQFGGMIDTEEVIFPFHVCRYIRGADVVRIRDGVARTARLRRLPQERLRHAPTQQGSPLLPRANGTYLLTGGVGALGLAVAEFLVENGARRLVLISRRSLPPRKTWDSVVPEDNNSTHTIIGKFKALEDRGATVHAISLDITGYGAAEHLTTALNNLSLPKVLGVIHAAGALEDQAVLETTRDAFARVLAPKVRGALLLHELFPPGSVDFFVLFSSCGHLLGFPGQSSYGSGNAFLDQLAIHRWQRGDNAVAFQWTAWRGMGMGASTDFIAAELESRGITDITADEAFRAWRHLAKYNVNHGVVLRSRVLEEDDPLPHPILKDIAMRRARATNTNNGAVAGAVKPNIPNSGPELKVYLNTKVRGCVAHVLHLSDGDIDSKKALSDYGVDSVMMASVRRELQATLKVSVPPTLTWSHPTVGHLVDWFAERVGK